MTDTEQSTQQEVDWTWRQVELLIEDLKRDGYTPVDIKTNTSEAVEEKTVCLEISREVDDGSA